MDQERPRSDLSINSRNDLRKVLHLESLYKENKVCAFQVWRPVLELSLAMPERSWALPSHQRPVAGDPARCESRGQPQAGRWPPPPSLGALRTRSRAGRFEPEL